MSRQVLILGGSGFVGRSLAARLARAGDWQIRIPSRRPARARALSVLPGVRLQQADVHDPAELERLVEGCDAVVNLVAILHGSRAQFERVHVQLPGLIARACERAGVPRLIHVSALGVPLGAGGAPLGVADSAPSDYLRSKARGEERLRQAALALTVLRPSVIFGAEDRFLNLFAALQAAFPCMPLAGAKARFQPVWVEDVAEAIQRCLSEPSTSGQTIECAGPKVWTLRQIVRAAGAWSGHPRPIVPLPDALGRLQAVLLGLLPGEPLMSVDNLASMRVPNIASGRLPGLERLGIQPAALESVMPAVLRRGQ
ncbi:MAG: complex I NDUFA9 subunit family protein [Leptothrix sp. (in: b-proteobacteria)]